MLLMMNYLSVNADDVIKEPDYQSENDPHQDSCGLYAINDSINQTFADLQWYISVLWV